jgi:glycosyltransferase involved in cell wall biosynthesis
MKVALVSQEYPPLTAKGGIGTQTLQKAEGLSKKGHHVYVISRSLDQIRHEHSSGNITVIRIPGLESSFPTMNETVQWISYSLQVAKELESLNEKVKLDLVDFPEWGAEGYIFLVNRQSWNYIPVVIQLHGPLVMLANTVDWPDKKSSFFIQGTHLESTCVKLADGVYSSSECSANWIRSFYDNSLKEIPIIHLGVDPEVFYPLTYEKPNKFTVVFAGKIVPNKGVEELINAIALLKLKNIDVNLKLLGRTDNNYIKHLQELTAQKEIQNQVNFPGFIDKTELPKQFSTSHIFAAPSWYEGGPGFVYLEAMASGLPVIGCSGSGVEEIITHGYNGLLVPPKNAEALAEAIELLAANPKILEEISVNARQYVLDNANTTDCLQKLEEYYYKIILKAKSEVC